MFVINVLIVNKGSNGCCKSLFTESEELCWSSEKCRWTSVSVKLLCKQPSCLTELVSFCVLSYIVASPICCWSTLILMNSAKWRNPLVPKLYGLLIHSVLPLLQGTGSASVFITWKCCSLDINEWSNNSMLEMWLRFRTDASIIQPSGFSR